MRHIQRLARIGIDERHQHHPGALASGSGPAAAHARQHKEASFSKKFTLSERES